ncbi:hypothetical protein IscW_ISCW002860 [Ixodes scapularis]|uniref:Uncharacterized protein n=1 Tax=Ixodes scapularis TaxID=6945 RepID=B7P7N9_IXOSC|nr:hypothetical protein IscW_ISCW002860 [Ixodes scapularis]|eukprot:XP_002399408.1 hypothetical protein IscW_ISCW002860 [Ixodes scapularis]
MAAGCTGQAAGVNIVTRDSAACLTTGRKSRAACGSENKDRLSLERLASVGLSSEDFLPFRDIPSGPSS